MSGSSEERWIEALLAELGEGPSVPPGEAGPPETEDGEPEFGPAGLLIVFVAVAWFVPSYFFAAPAPGSDGADIPLGALSAAAVAAGEHWRVVTMVVEHAGPHHLLANAGFIWVFSSELEARHGTAATSLLMFAATVGASALAIWSGPERIYVGASGLGCGLMGAVLATAPEPAVSPALGFAVLTALWSLLPNVSFAAHAGGFAVGLVLGGALRVSPALYWLVAVPAAVGLAKVAVAAAVLLA